MRNPPSQWVSQALQQSVWQRYLLASWTHRGWLSWLLRPLSLLFGSAVRLRQGLYLSGLRRTERIRVPLIVVGNVVAGGAGKTPVVLSLLQHLQTQGWQPGVISRGHGRRTRDCREVRDDSLAQDVGDEPALVKRHAKVPVYVATRRADAAHALLQDHPLTNVLISDDGLQHLGLARDIEICVFDDRGIGNGLLLPAGPLREPWPRYVDLVLHTGRKPAFTGYRAQRALAREAVRADGQRIALSALAQNASPLLALAGIAQPQTFFNMLRDEGLPLALTLALPDHADLSSWTPPQGIDYTLLCTEKDAVKLWQRHPLAWAVPLDFAPEPAFFSAVDQLLGEAPRSRLSSPHGYPTS